MSNDSILERCFPGRRAALKREILAQSLACFNESGVEATTIDAIKARCDTSVGAIYHHFGNKEGILAALFFAALDDQHAFRKLRLDEARSLKEVVSAIVASYVQWVVENPEWARFLYAARHAVATGPHRQSLKERNAAKAAELRQAVIDMAGDESAFHQPQELLSSLLIGSSDNYCRAWIAGRVKTSPDQYIEQLTEAAWRSVMVGI